MSDMNDPIGYFFGAGLFLILLIGYGLGKVF